MGRVEDDFITYHSGKFRTAPDYMLSRGIPRTPVQIVDIDNEIDFESEVIGPLAEFDSVETDSPETVISWRRTTCEQGLIYREAAPDYIDRYRGQFIYLQDGKVVWSGEDPSKLGSRRKLSGDKKDSALWLKLVDPEETESEHYEAYEEALQGLAA